jgi:uncharacterized membrane protein
VISGAEAQQHADRIRAFQQELERLERENVIALSDAQTSALREHHDRLLADYVRAFDIDGDARAKQLSLGMRVTSFLGALALAASVFFLFYQFWGFLTTATQVALLATISLGTYLGTLWLQRRDPGGYFTNLAALVAWACFVLNISMFGQMFNIAPSDKALIPWAVLAFLLAYVCNLRLLLAFAILCLIAFLAARAGEWRGCYWLDFGERPENFFPAALLIFLIPSAISHRRFPGFAPLYRIFGLLTLLLPILVLSHWGRGSYLDLSNAVIEGGYQVLGFSVSGAAVWLGARRQWPHVVNTGATFFVILLYTKFHDWWWEIMPKYLFFLVVGATAVLLLLGLKRLRATGAA